VIYSALMLGFLLLAEAILRRQARPRRAQDYDLFPVQPVTWDAIKYPVAWYKPNPRADLITIEAKSPMDAWKELLRTR
jgi:hypothetical protein